MHLCIWRKVLNTQNITWIWCRLWTVAEKEERQIAKRRKKDEKCNKTLRKTDRQKGIKTKRKKEREGKKNVIWRKGEKWKYDRNKKKNKQKTNKNVKQDNYPEAITKLFSFHITSSLVNSKIIFFLLFLDANRYTMHFLPTSPIMYIKKQKNPGSVWNIEQSWREFLFHRRVWGLLICGYRPAYIRCNNLPCKEAFIVLLLCFSVQHESQLWWRWYLCQLVHV